MFRRPLASVLHGVRTVGVLIKNRSVLLILYHQHDVPRTPGELQKVPVGVEPRFLHFQQISWCPCFLAHVHLNTVPHKRFQ